MPGDDPNPHEALFLYAEAASLKDGHDLIISLDVNYRVRSDSGPTFDFSLQIARPEQSEDSVSLQLHPCLDDPSYHILVLSLASDSICLEPDYEEYMDTYEWKSCKYIDQDEALVHPPAHQSWRQMLLSMPIIHWVKIELSSSNGDLHQCWS